VLAQPPLFVGIDIGTSGCRGIAIDENTNVVASSNIPLPAPQISGKEITQEASLWWQALVACLTDLGKQTNPGTITRLAIDGTSSTVLLCNAAGKPLTPALMYNDARAGKEADRITVVADERSAANGASSSLAKILWLLKNRAPGDIAHIQHQADWLSGKLTGCYGQSDYNNCLKLGYDPQAKAWPDWITKLGVRPDWLPRVYAPGEVYNEIDPDIAEQLGLSPNVKIVAGTTDSIAAFLASGATQIGDATTSLGSTLVLKLLSDKPIASIEHGIYSHRLGDLWLAGGASNSGGAVLKQYFTDEEMAQLSTQLQPDCPTGLDYYPLPGPGERFPVNDPNLMPRIKPVPDNKLQLFQGLLEGIAHIEQQGYQLLQQLGAPELKQVFTSGGGSRNQAWSEMRQARLGVPVKTAMHTEAAYGSALLAAGRITHLSASQ